MNTSKNKFVKFNKFTLRNKLKFVTYFIIFQNFVILFRLFGYKKTKNIADKLKISTKDPKILSSSYVISETKIINQSTINFILNSTCLEKSLFIYLILGHRGINCELKVGIDNTDDVFSAHAWVEYGDIILNDSFENIEKFKTIQML